MPEATIASAVSRTVCSLTSQANLFQLFQPIGGVRARPFGALFTTSCVVSASAGAANKLAASDQPEHQFHDASHCPPPLLFASCVSATNRRCKQPEGRIVRSLRALLAWSLADVPLRRPTRNRRRFRESSNADGRHALLVDGAPFLILGAQTNNSSNYPAILPEVWPVIDRDPRQHGRDSSRLGADRAGGGQVRFFMGRHAPSAGAPAQRAARPALVRCVQEHEPELRARMGEGRHQALPADDHQGRQNSLRPDAARRLDAARRTAAPSLR